MGLIEDIDQMKQQGIDDQSILNQLQEQGYTPKQISDAISQSQIKNAVSESVYYDQNTGQEQYYQDQQYSEGGMQDYSGQRMNDNAVEIAEQVFNEKITKFQNQLEDLMQFKAVAETQMKSASERLKKIETTIDQLQMAILKKIGSYGSTLEGIKEEMSMMQNSFRKVVDDKVNKKISK